MFRALGGVRTFLFLALAVLWAIEGETLIAIGCAVIGAAVAFLHPGRKRDPGRGD